MVTTILVLGLETGSFRRAASVLTAEPNIQPSRANFTLVTYCPVAKSTCSVLDSHWSIFILFHVSKSFSVSQL